MYPPRLKSKRDPAIEVGSDCDLFVRMPGPPLARSPRRPCTLALRSSPPQRRISTPAIVLPSPAITAYLASISLLVYFTTRPLLARAASFYLGTSVRLRSLRLCLFRKQLSLGGIDLSDPRGRPLLALDELHVALRRSDATTTKDTQNRDNTNPQRVVDITLTKPSVVAIFDKYDFSESNWTLFTSNFNRRRGGGKLSADARLPSPPRRSSEPSSSSSPATDVRVSVVNGVHLSLRSALLDNERLVDDVTLSNVSISFSELRSPERLTNFVDALAGRAVRSARVRSFPSQFRTGARRYARRVLADGLAKGIRVTRERVREVRKGVDRVDEFVFRDLPDAGAAGEAVKNIRNALRGLESILGGAGDGDETTAPESSRSGRRESRQGQSIGDRGDIEYRELDEGAARPEPAQEGGR